MLDTSMIAVPRYVAEAISIGDKVYTGSGEVGVEVIDLKTSPARRKTIENGSYTEVIDPDFTAGEITLKLRSLELDNQDYWNLILPIQVGRNFELSFDHVVFDVTITEIVSVEAIDN
jgi:hypothetical protein